MNTLRQIFGARTLAALRQNNFLNNLPLDSNITPANHASTAATANVNNSFLPKELLSTCLLKTTQLGIGNESFVKNVKNVQQLDRKLEIAYRCKICNTRNLKTISEAAYNKGVVILQCDGCSTTHLKLIIWDGLPTARAKASTKLLKKRANLFARLLSTKKANYLKTK